jgi:hypothetical protein
MLSSARNAIMISAIRNTTGFPIENVLKIGANEAKREFGSMTKKGVAELIAAEYPRFRLFEHKTGFLFDEVLEQKVEADVSDAICIAIVASRRIRRDELAMG